MSARLACSRFERSPNAFKWPGERHGADMGEGMLVVASSAVALRSKKDTGGKIEVCEYEYEEPEMLRCGSNRCTYFRGRCRRARRAKSKKRMIRKQS